MKKYKNLSDYLNDVIKRTDRNIKALEFSRKLGSKMLEKHFANKLAKNGGELMGIATFDYSFRKDEPNEKEWYDNVSDAFNKMVKAHKDNYG